MKNYDRNSNSNKNVKNINFAKNYAKNNNDNALALLLLSLL